MSEFVEGKHFEVDANGCHHWIRATSHDGYAHAVIDGQHIYAHRHVWQEAHGPLADGMTVDHLCFNPSCINIDHLRELDFLTNSRLQRSALKTHCVNGHPFDSKNTYIRPGDGRRACRTCRVAVNRRRRERKRLAGRDAA